MTDQEDIDSQEELGPSKSQRKRDMLYLHKLAERLTELSDSLLKKLNLSEDSIAALSEARRMKASGARNRQLKFAAKLLSQIDVTEAVNHLEGQATVIAEINRAFHNLEIWRDRLITEGDKALAELIAKYPDLDRQQLRSLVRNAQMEKDKGKPAGAGKKLFRALREQILE